jgi:hypothetical protein
MSAVLEVMRVDSAREPVDRYDRAGIRGIGRPLWIFHELVTAAVAKQEKALLFSSG